MSLSLNTRLTVKQIEESLQLVVVLPPQVHNLRMTSKTVHGSTRGTHSLPLCPFLVIQEDVVQRRGDQCLVKILTDEDDCYVIDDQTASDAALTLLPPFKASACDNAVTVKEARTIPPSSHKVLLDCIDHLGIVGRPFTLLDAAHPRSTACEGKHDL
jgi:hypothetical protein